MVQCSKGPIMHFKYIEQHLACINNAFEYRLKSFEMHPVFGCSWDFCGALGLVLGVSWDLFGPSWVNLGASWAALEAILGPFGPLLERLGATKSIKKSIRKLIRNQVGSRHAKNGSNTTPADVSELDKP